MKSTNDDTTWLSKGVSTGLVVMGGDSCFECVGLNPTTGYRMHIFHINLLENL